VHLTANLQGLYRCSCAFGVKLVEMERTTFDMKLKRIFLMPLALLALAAQMAFTQNTPPTPPSPAEMAQQHIQHLATMLSLTPAQQQQAQSIMTTLLTSEQAGHDQMRQTHEALLAAVKANNAAGIQQAANTVGSLTAQGIADHAKAAAAFYQILTPDQQTKFNEMLPMMFGPGGPGPMRHAGPHPPE
jgi:Spy/CpxP family protein refolding chaperone